ncbi:MAG: thymidine phosphorylase [Clostridia bacterium]|nr:thymidine phosphorylase [Clostridia bacterium]
MYELITKKKKGVELSTEEIKYIVEGFTKGDIPDYQMSAFCMAVIFNGMTDRETSDLTLAMAESGDVVDLSCFGDKSCDKHSSGGVGDKTTLIVAPIVASLGGVVAKMSGRGLGHTGGTVDKLESIPGYRTELTPDEFMSVSEKCGLCVCGQSGNLAPADKKLYALRDVTATVDSIPLIVSSIMSKKIAAGSKNIMLDVKCGSGAFMKTPEDAKRLAEGMEEIGKRCGRNTKALITNMDVPLGFAVGNSLEVIEAIEVLKGKLCGDIREVSVCLAAGLVANLKGIDTESAKALCEKAIDDGSALSKFRQWIALQGGDVSVIDNTELFPAAKYAYEIKADTDGYISHMNAEKIGLCSCELGAGRKTKTDIIDLSAGLVLSKKTGDFVKCGEEIARLYTNKEDSLAKAEEVFMSALEFSERKPEAAELIIDKVE